MAAAQRPGSQGRKNSVCQVPGCGVDVSGLKPYNQRHKVCDEHLKAPLVEKDGLRQRFCQQCSRFHEVTEFDNDRRSCRKRLNKHNVRRRKTPTSLAAYVSEVSLASGSSAELASNSPGAGSSPTGSGGSGLPDDGQLYASGSKISDLLKSRGQKLMKQTRRAPRANISMPDLRLKNSSPQTANEPSRLGVIPDGGIQEAGSSSVEPPPGSIYTPTISTSHLFIIVEGCSASDLPLHLKSHFVEIFQGLVQMSVCDGAHASLLWLDIIQSAGGTKLPTLRSIVNSLTSAGCEDMHLGSIWLQRSWSAQYKHDGVQVSGGQIIQEYDLTREDKGADIISRAALHHGHFGPVLQLKLGTSQKAEITDPAWAIHARCDGYAMPVDLQSFLGLSQQGISISASLRGVVQRGVVRIQASLGGVVGNTKTVVMTDKADLARELHAAHQLVPDLDLLHEEVGSLVSFQAALEDGGATGGLSWVLVSSRNLLRDIASNILCLACEQGWLAMASLAMGALTCNQEAAAVVIEEIRLRSPGLPSLLHRAVRSQNPDTVKWLLAWGEARGYDWDVTGGSQSVEALAQELGNQEVMRVLQGRLSVSATTSHSDVSMQPGQQSQQLHSSASSGAGHWAQAAGPMQHSSGYSAVPHDSSYQQPFQQHMVPDNFTHDVHSMQYHQSFGTTSHRPSLSDLEFNSLGSHNIWGSVIDEGPEELEAAVNLFMNGEDRPPSFTEQPRRRRSSLTRRSTWAPSDFLHSMGGQ